MKTLTLVRSGIGRPDLPTMIAMEETDLYPRASLFQRVLNSDILDEAYLARLSGWKGWITKRVPIMPAQLLEALIVHNRYDAIISWAEHLGLPFALLQKITRSRTPHVAIWSWISKPKKAEFLRRVHQNVDRLILMSSLQRDFALQELGLPSEKVTFGRWPVDTKFWRPLQVEQDMICSVGREMRDYVTLVRALRTLDIPCHIAANPQADKKDAWVSALLSEGPLPSTITIGSKSYAELRDLYARSRFLVMPVLETETDNGTTSILEAMAMGKAVICSRTKGQRDVIQDGVTGIFVPVGDVQALARAIEDLWNHPDKAAQMGSEGRKFVESHHDIEIFVNHVKSTVEGAIQERKQHA
jgi:glycosyltransferase involved in cell wall biosynthesis